MGYLTTFTIYNDGVDLLDDKEKALKFVEELKDAAHGLQEKDISLGSFCNFCRVQKPRHADDRTIYVHAGNTVLNVDPYTTNKIMDGNKVVDERLMKSMYKRNKNYFKKILETIAQDTKELVDMMEEEDVKQCIIEDTGILPNKKISDKIHQELMLEGFRNKENFTLNNYIKLFN